MNRGERKNKMENLAEKNVGKEKNINVRQAVILLQTIYLVYSLVAVWTNAFGEIRTFFYILNVSDWEKILFFVAYVYVLQIYALKVEKYYFLGVLLYAMIFILETITCLTLIVDRNSSGISQEALNVNLWYNMFSLGFVLVIVVLSINVYRKIKKEGDK
jgi:hypothetical protein